MTAIVLLALVSPALRDRDSFPLSNYPMYASARGDTAVFSTVMALDTEGAPVRLSLPVVADADDALVGEARVEQAIADGAAAALCAEVARRVPDGVARVRVVTERHELVALVAGDESLVDRDVHASCEPTS